LKAKTVDEYKREKIAIIEKAVVEIEGESDIKRLITYSGYTLRVLEEYKLRLQKMKAKQLAETMTDCFKQISSKQNLIDEIQIDADTLDFRYLDRNGDQVNRTSFSAGEKQLLVIAMLWALGKCSKKRFPVIIDTPLARLDSLHRETLITNYFPKASEQTILLSTDSEVYGKYYELLKPYIGNEFTLIYDDEAMQSTIQPGYFGGTSR
jgi:DNA sulfur modification protein DndD